MVLIIRVFKSNRINERFKVKSNRHCSGCIRESRLEFMHQDELIQVCMQKGRPLCLLHPYKYLKKIGKKPSIHYYRMISMCIKLTKSLLIFMYASMHLKRNIAISFGMIQRQMYLKEIIIISIPTH